LLARQCSPAGACGKLAADRKYHPWPRIGDPAWSEVRPHTRAALLAAVGAILRHSFQAMPASLFLDMPAMASHRLEKVRGAI